MIHSIVNKTFHDAEIIEVRPISARNKNLKRIVLNLNGEKKSLVLKTCTSYETEINLHLQNNFPFVIPHIYHVLGQQILMDSFGKRASPEEAKSEPFIHFLVQVHDIVFCGEIIHQTIEELSAKLVDIHRLFKQSYEKYDVLAKTLGKIDFNRIEAFTSFVDQNLYLLQIPSMFTFTHQDLHFKNILRENNNFKIIDWEFARMGNPLIDLASVVTLGEMTHIYLEKSKLLQKYHLSYEKFEQLFIVARMYKVLMAYFFRVIETSHLYKADKNLTMLKVQARMNRGLLDQYESELHFLHNKYATLRGETYHVGKAEGHRI